MSAADAVTQDRVYRALKSEYLAGEFSVGAKLELAAMADRLRSSKTPVREAIHRLVGEQIMEADPGGGFRIWQPAPGHLIQLYQWNAHLLLGLVSLMSPADLVDRIAYFDGLGPPGSKIELVMRQGSIFGSIADASGNSEAVAAIVHINERLLSTRIAEIADLKEGVRELRTLTNIAVADVQKSMRRRLESYHERRIQQQRDSLEKASKEV
jgi:hypothetical protein